MVTASLYQLAETAATLFGWQSFAEKPSDQIV